MTFIESLTIFSKVLIYFYDIVYNLHSIYTWYMWICIYVAYTYYICTDMWHLYILCMKYYTYLYEIVYNLYCVIFYMTNDTFILLWSSVHPTFILLYVLISSDISWARSACNQKHNIFPMQILCTRHRNKFQWFIHCQTKSSCWSGNLNFFR